jgi:5-(carboxyamino)imidazole ribonucleotide synthase
MHKNGILSCSTVPSGIPDEVAKEAITAARRLAESLDYVGVIAVEFFVTASGLLFNEFAPRVHNSGHWTDDACATGQFEQHIRAVAGWPLGDPTRHADAVMTNLIGDDALRWQEIAAEPGARLHLYGKKEIRQGRKMGHVTRLKPRP